MMKHNVKWPRERKERRCHIILARKSYCVTEIS